MTRVTVLMAAYNAERYLAEAARSALAQTHRDLELVIADDGSTDRTKAIAESLGDERVRVLSIANGGQAAARNVALAAAAPSEFVAILDADDRWDEDKLERQLEHLSGRRGVIAAGCFMRYLSSGGRVLGETGQVIDARAMEAMRHGALAPFPVSSLIVRRSSLEAIGGFDPALSGAEDLECFARLARRGAIEAVPRVLGDYRVHPESVMATRRFHVNMYARFIQARLSAQDAGGDLTIAEFTRAYRPSFFERRRDWIEYWYRSAGLWNGEGKGARALGYGMLAAATAPVYTIRRLMRQRLGRPRSVSR